MRLAALGRFAATFFGAGRFADVFFGAAALAFFVPADFFAFAETVPFADDVFFLAAMVGGVYTLLSNTRSASHARVSLHLNESFYEFFGEGGSQLESTPLALNANRIEPFGAEPRERTGSGRSGWITRAIVFLGDQR